MLERWPDCTVKPVYNGDPISWLQGLITQQSLYSPGHPSLAWDPTSLIVHVILTFSVIIERWPEVTNLSALGLPYNTYHFKLSNFLLCNSIKENRIHVNKVVIQISELRDADRVVSDPLLHCILVPQWTLYCPDRIKSWKCQPG